MKYLHNLKEILCKELDEYSGKTKMTAGDLETVHKLTDTIKNIDKIMMLEEDGGHSERRGYSRDGEWMARGEYGHGGSYEGDSSYARRKRDSMGRYSRDGGMFDGETSHRGGYSRDGGKDELREMVDDMMGMATTERMREALHRLKTEIDKE